MSIMDRWICIRKMDSRWPVEKWSHVICHVGGPEVHGNLLLDTRIVTRLLPGRGVLNEKNLIRSQSAIPSESIGLKKLSKYPH